MRKISFKRPGRLAAGAALMLALAGGGAFLAGTFDNKAKAAADAGPPTPPPANVRVAEAMTTELAPHSDAPGSVVSVNDSLIAAATPGTTATIQPGTAVHFLFAAIV